MIIKRSLWMAPLVCLVIASHASGQLNVHVEQRGKPAGKGVAMSRGLDCYVLTAAHVVAPETVRVVGAGRRSSFGTRTFADPTADLAAIQVAEPANVCGRDFYLRASDVWDRVTRQQSGLLRLMSEHGQEENVAVMVSTDRRTLESPGSRARRQITRFIWVKPQEDTNQLGDLHSGAMLYVEGQPAGILVEVSTDGTNIGKVLPIDRIERLVRGFLPIAQPTGEVVRLDPVLAADHMRKSVAYMNTTEFCRNLLTVAKWISKPERFTYTARRTSSTGGMEYDIDSWLFPERITVLTMDDERSRRTTKTLVGYVPGAMPIEEQWDAMERSIDSCVHSSVGREKGLRHRDGPRQGTVGRDTRWVVEGRGIWSGPTANIWLKSFGKEIEIQIWEYD